MALEDIEKLKEKVSRDPNSKLFVPLSDEYRKMGMLDEAISVLITGLENQPNYMSARVALGKVYFEKQMLAEAKEEFEKVVAAIPDNLFAHKKLAEVCRDLGHVDKAISEYRVVLKLNPLDDDSVSNLDALQKMPKVAEAPAAPEPPPVLQHTSHAAMPEPDVEEEEMMLPAEEAAPAVHGDEFEAFRQSMVEKTEGPDEAEEEIIAEDIDLKEVEKEAMTYAEMFKEKATEESRLETPLNDVIEVVEEPDVKPAAKSEGPDPRIKEAESFIASGNYPRAINIYSGILSENPDNKLVLQKIEELKMLLKMLGKGQEAVVAKLEAFSEGLKKRKNEFFKST